MEEILDLQDKLKKTYDVIMAFQKLCEANGLHYMQDKQISTAMNRLLGEV